MSEKLNSMSISAVIKYLEGRIASRSGIPLTQYEHGQISGFKIALELIQRIEIPTAHDDPAVLESRAKELTA